MAAAPVSKKDKLAHLNEIFAGQIDSDVVQIILTECKFNVNTALETLLALTEDTAIAHSTHPSDASNTSSTSIVADPRRLSTCTFHPTTILSPDDFVPPKAFPTPATNAYRLHHHHHQGTDKPFQLLNGDRPTSFIGGGAAASAAANHRISTIYKSNEALYFEDVAHDHDFNCGVVSPSAPSIECLRNYDAIPGLLRAPRAQTRDAAAAPSLLSSPISPNSDRSIEADASESIHQIDHTSSSDLPLTNHRARNNSNGHVSTIPADIIMSGKPGGRNTTGDNRPFARKYSQSRQSQPNDIRTSYGMISPEMQAILNQSMSAQQRDAFYRGDRSGGGGGGVPTNDFSRPPPPINKQPRVQPSPPPPQPPHRPNQSHMPRPAKRNADNKGPGLLPDPPVGRAPTPAAAAAKRPSPHEIAVNKIQSGAKVLIIIRGVPGSGKTTLARSLLALKGANVSGLVVSTDDHFKRDGKYRFDPEQLPMAHARTRALAIKAMQLKRSPVIVDNTNTQAWEMVPYVAAALLHHYFFWVMQPETPWRYDVVELTRRNVHGVRQEQIQRMLDRFDRSLGSEKLKLLALQYLEEKGLAAKVPLQANNPSPAPNQPKNAQQRARSHSKQGRPPRPSAQPTEIPVRQNHNPHQQQQQQNPHHQQQQQQQQQQHEPTSQEVRPKNRKKKPKKAKPKPTLADHPGVVQLGTALVDLKPMVGPPGAEGFARVDGDCVDRGGGLSTADWSDVQDGETWSMSSSDSDNDDYSDCGSTQSSNVRGPARNTSLHKSKSVPNLVDGVGIVGPNGTSERNPRTSKQVGGPVAPPDDDEELREINLMLLDQHEINSSLLDGGPDDWDGLGDALIDSWLPVSDNMKDLMTIDFSQPTEELSSSATSVTSISTSPTTTTTTEDLDFAGVDVTERSAASLEPDDSLFGRLKLSLNPNWDMPAYPGSASTDSAHSISKYNVFAELSKPSKDTPSPLDDRIVCSDDDQSSRATAAPSDDDAAFTGPAKPVSSGEAITASQSRENHLSALKAFFASISLVDLTDIFDNCNGDIQWTVNTLLDAGYEMNSSPVVSQPAAGDASALPDVDRPPKSESSLEGLAELTMDDDRFEVLSAVGITVNQQPSLNVDAVSVSTENGDESKVDSTDRLPPPPSVTSSSSWTSEATGATQNGGESGDVSFRIDPFFAMQLERMFGPVGFHLEPASYCGDDLKVTIPMDVARSIHRSWDKSLLEKFQSEESELKNMTTDEDFARRIQAAEDSGSTLIIESDPTGQHFPQLEKQKLISLLQHKEMPDKTTNIASKIKRRQLYDMFPKIDPKSLDEVFQANEGSFSDTVVAIQDSYQPDEKPQLVIAPSQLEEYENALVKLALQESLASEIERAKDRSQVAGDASLDSTYDELRAEASIHYYLRQECFQKAREAYGNNMRSVASYYSQQGHAHTKKLNDANARAAKKILEFRNAGRSSRDLDLHCLHVPEAMQALVVFMDEKKRELRSGSNPRMTVNIITGKGNHSVMGMARIRPAVIDYLIKHNYSFTEPHGGQFEVILSKYQNAV